MDFTDLNEVLKWLKQIQPCSDHRHVGVPSQDIVDTFHDHGFYENANTDEHFQADNRENVARYIIGQALSQLIGIGAIHPIIRKFTAEWRDNFGKGKQ